MSVFSTSKGEALALGLSILIALGMPPSQMSGTQAGVAILSLTAVFYIFRYLFESTEQVVQDDGLVGLVCLFNTHEYEEVGSIESANERVVQHECQRCGDKVTGRVPAEPEPDGVSNRR